MLEKLSRLREDVLEKLNNVGNLDELNDLKVKVLGKKGEFTAIMKGMAEIDPYKIYFSYISPHIIYNDSM